MISKILTIFLCLEEVRANLYFSHGQQHLLPQIQRRSQLMPIQKGIMGMVSPVLSFKPVFLLTDKYSSSSSSSSSSSEEDYVVPLNLKNLRERKNTIEKPNRGLKS